MKKMNSNKVLRGSELKASGSENSNNKTSNRRLIMKKLMLTIAMVLGTFGMSFAQNNANQNVTINAAVIQALTLSVNTATLNLGTMVAGTTPTAVDPTTSPIQFTLTGNGGSVIHVSYAAVTLSGPSASTMTFTPNVTGDPSSSNQASATAVASGSTVTLSGANYSSQNYYFWLGGGVGSLPSNQTPGAYSGTFTLNVTY
jgi:Domain of unknown function (DUF4402)